VKKLAGPPPKTELLVKTMSTDVTAAVIAAALLAPGCGGSGGSSGQEMVWCVAPGEKVTAEFKREYPELYMTKAACDAVNK
jgi:hypothetical protein